MGYGSVCKGDDILIILCTCKLILIIFCLTVHYKVIWIVNTYSGDITFYLSLHTSDKILDNN